VKTLLLLFCLVVPLAVNCTGQTTATSDSCHGIAEYSEGGLSSEICSWIVAHLAPGESTASVAFDGSYMTLTADGMLHQHTLPPKYQSVLLLESVKRDIGQIEEMVRTDTDPAHPKTAMLEQALEAWSKVRDNYCNWHPGETYADYSDQKQTCPGSQANGTEAAIPATGSAGLQTSRSDAGVAANVLGTRTCQKAITFAYAGNGALVYRLPDVSHKWLDQFQRKYHNVCFLQYGAHSGQQNYLVVLSSSASAYKGLQPVFRTSTTTTPVSGNGTLTDNSGSTWNFTYQGTETTTTTTQTNVLYTDTTSELYANAYTEDGTLVGSSERSASSRQGGDPSNAAGYNLMSALLSIHLKEHLLESVVKKVNALP
jgi:hypothetical protein